MEMAKKDKEEHFAYAIQLVDSMALPMVLHTAVQLGVLEVISKAGPDAQLSPSDIVSSLGFPNPDAPVMLDRMFRLLASYSILSCSLSSQSERVYGLSPVGKYFVENKDGASLGNLLALIQDKVFIDSWYKLKDAVIEGGTPFDMVHGSHAFEYPGRDPRFNEVFNKAMINHTTIVIGEVLNSYQGFNNLNRLVDVGGGLGVTLSFITSKYPTIKGINFDLPHVIKDAPQYSGVEHIGGDMFESVPNGDAIFMKWILHDWSDDHCLKLLKNCYNALPDNGKVIVMEAVLPVLPDTSSTVKATTEMDAIMMTQNPGGKERTHSEFLALAIGAGFSGIRLECSVCNFRIMEFYK